MLVSVVRCGFIIIVAVLTFPQSTYAQRAFDHDILKGSFGYDRNFPRGKLSSAANIWPAAEAMRMPRLSGCDLRLPQ